MQILSQNMELIGRLQQRPEFLRVATEGRKWVSTSLVLQAAPNNLEQTRFGLTVTKKVYKQAVKRNRIRRRMRTTAYHILPLMAQPGYDFVLIGKASALDCPFEQLMKDLTWCLKRMELLK